MKRKYYEIYSLAVLLYQKSRISDLDHINWLLKTVPRFNKYFDEDILIPLIILHDVGYSFIKTKDSRKEHMKKGALLSFKILTSLKYDLQKIKIITRLISIHDNWAFGKSFKDEPLLQFFNNFDFMWMASKKGFKLKSKSKNKKPHELLNEIKKLQRVNIKEGRFWYNKKIEKYYEKLIGARKKEYNL